MASEMRQDNMVGKSEQEKSDISFVAYCCGNPMLKEQRGNHVHFRCANASHGRGFSMSIDPDEQSYCSCAGGGAPLITKDFGDFRFYGGCPYCGARYSVYKEGAQIVFDVQGSKADEVKEVSAEGMALIWDHMGRGPGLGSDAKSIFSQGDLAEMIRGIRPDLTVGVRINKSHQVSISGNVVESTIHTERSERSPFLKSLFIAIVASTIATIVLEYFGIIDLIKGLP